MKNSRVIALCACFVLAHAHDQCDPSEYSLEILRVQDASGDFYEYVDSLMATTEEFVSELASNFGEFKYGLSSFLDKPIPTRGMGHYGNFASLHREPDYCFKSHGYMSSDAESIRSGLETLSAARGWGGDIPENPYEALIFAAYANDSVGWSPPQTTHTKEGRPIARFALVVTDAIPHEAGDAYDGAALAWNDARTYADPDKSSGGFGSRTWESIPNLITYSNDKDHDDYIEMSNLFRTGDLGGVLTSQEQARLDALILKFGPYPWPVIENHPGDASKECNATEYPSLAQVAAAMKKFEITPIILVAEPAAGWGSEAGKKCSSLGLPTDLDCLKQIYTQGLAATGIDFVVASVSVETDADVIVESLRTGVEQLCNRPTQEPKAQLSLNTTLTMKDTACETGLRINWFHLQEDGPQWKGRMEGMLKEWKQVADTVDSYFPKSRFGAGTFGEVEWHYAIEVNLSEKTEATNALEKGWLGTFPSKPIPEIWPELTTNLKQWEYKNLKSEAQAPLEPVIWTALHIDWDDGPDVVKIITINQQTPAHFSGDGSAEAVDRGKKVPFDLDTYPVTQRSIWPAGPEPKTSANSDYTSLELVRSVLAEQNVHLIVNYGATGDYQSEDTWKYVLKELGIDSSLFLHFLPGSMITMCRSVMEGMQRAMGCTWPPRTTTTPYMPLR